jgi:hypothetical protein
VATRVLEKEEIIDPVATVFTGNDKVEDHFNTETHRNMERLGDAKVTV